jgi:hypothetical protein
VKDIVAELDDLLRWFDEPVEVLATIRRARDVIVAMRQQQGPHTIPGAARMIEPTSQDIGRVVWYRDRSGQKSERGVISSFNERFVFVRYTEGSTAAATDRLDLYWPHTDAQDATKRPFAEVAR